MKINLPLPAYFLCLLAMLSAPFAAQAQTAQPTCSAASLNGTYYLSLTGRNVNASTALSAAYQAVGTATFDGAGNVTFHLVANTNLLSGVQQTLAGTYNPGSTCMGTLNITAGDSEAFTLIVYNKGANFTITGQNATYALTGSGGPQPLSCITSLLSGNYGFSGTGFTLSQTSITGVNTISGLLQFDGRGNITGNWSIATNGVATPDTISGHYTISAACQGTTTVTGSSGTVYTLSFTMTSADGADFTVIGATPATQFSASGHSTFTNPGLAVLNAASGVSSGTPPGSLFALYGENLATALSSATKVPLPTTLLSTSVTVNGELAPLFFVSQTQINAQMPWDIQPGLANVVVTTSSGQSNTVAVLVPATAVPGIFPQFPGTQAVAVQYPEATLNTPAAPANVGDTVVAYFTGGGPVQAAGPLVTGAYSPVGLSPVTAANTTVSVAGVSAVVNYAGLTGDLVGVYQVNFVVPKVSAGDRKLVLTIAGQASVATDLSIAN